jgi:hypothetical protein
VVAAIKTSYLTARFKDVAFNVADVVIWSTAETSVTIIAASIPFFRTLIKHASTRGPSGQRNQSYRLGSLGGSRGFGGTKDRTRGQDRVTGDDNSDIGIMEGAAWPAGGRIVKESAVTVEFSQERV